MTTPLLHGNTRLVGQCEQTVCKRFCIPGNRTHIDRVGPAVGWAVINIAPAYNREEATSKSLDCAGLPTSLPVVRDSGVYGEPLSLHCLYCPPLQRFIGGVDTIPLTWRT